jgi:hypothetical protein
LKDRTGKRRKSREDGHCPSSLDFRTVRTARAGLWDGTERAGQTRQDQREVKERSSLDRTEWQNSKDIVASLIMPRYVYKKIVHSILNYTRYYEYINTGTKLIQLLLH